VLTPALDTLVSEVGRALDAHPAALESGTGPDAARVCDRVVPAMRAFLAHPEAVAADARLPLEDAAVGNLLYVDGGARFHVLSVVFPEGTSSGIHRHGCWGVIGYLQGGDEETRYRAGREAGGHAELAEASRHVWHQGDVTVLLPPEEAWHRVRNPGPGPGVSVHVLCRNPATHPHLYWDRATGSVLPFPFVEVAPGRWRAELSDPPGSPSSPPSPRS
jgi:predicted metal-dependent enzyme (double-stranded beta helix superfamily)